MIPPFDIIIPARLEAKRLPGKPLLDVCGKPLIRRVYECACQSSAETITIATDNSEILHVARSFGANVCLTGTNHRSGTDRIAEATERLRLNDDHIIVNLQCDEPRMPGPLIDQVAEALSIDQIASLATACRPLESRKEFENHNVVKVVLDQNNYALYFSRSPIPWNQLNPHDVNWSIARGHIGLYAYRVSYLKRFLCQQPTVLEQAESLEQLRALENGDAIIVCDAKHVPGTGVDTLEDLEAVVQHFS